MMRRALALGVALLALIAAGFLWTRDRPVAVATESPRPAAEAEAEGEALDAGPLVAPRSDLTPEQREARRFARYDKDKDDRISRDEYLVNRRKTFAKLDKNGDGKLSFDEYSVKGVEKFVKADVNGDGALVAAEFATTAVKRKPKVGCACQPAVAE